jgi:carbon storage regulator
MLVIRRRAGEALLIGDGIEIEILECGASNVKLGIRAPKEIAVLRKEIHLTSRQNLTAAREASPDAVHRLLRTLR